MNAATLELPEHSYARHIDDVREMYVLTSEVPKDPEPIPTGRWDTLIAGKQYTYEIALVPYDQSANVQGNMDKFRPKAIAYFTEIQSSVKPLKLLAHAIELADGWHDESRGGPIKGDPLIDEARELVKEIKDDASGDVSALEAKA